MLGRDMRGRTKEIHKELQDLDPLYSPHLEERWIGGNIDLDLLSPFPQKYARIMGGMEEEGQALKINNGGERSPKMWLSQGGRRDNYRWGNLDVGSNSRRSLAISPALPDFRPDCPAASPAVAKKLLSSAVRRAAGFFRPGAKLFAKKKHQHENDDNFCIRTPFSMNLGSLESPQQALQLHS
jgi:hypothetical protein